MMKVSKTLLISMGGCFLIFAWMFSGCSAGEELVGFSSEDRVLELEIGTEAGEEDGSLETAEDLTEAETIMVYICGAVKNPGVITLQWGSRLNDAVEAAGGFADDAAGASVNLAARLGDEEMIYVPTMAEWMEAEASEASQTAAGSSLININTADIYALCSLPGIGESRAQDIIAYREKNGDFQKKEDIMQVTGIKDSLYEKICDRISVE